MKKGTGLLLVLSLLALLLIIVVVKSYRALSIANEEVKNKEVDINVQLTRKKEQITNLIKVSKKYINNEETLLKEIEQRSDSFEIVDKTLARVKCTVNEELVELLNKLFSKYDESMLQDEELKTAISDIISTEKRISVAQANYNKAVDEYNAKVRNFPTSLIAKLRGFSRKDRFTTSINLNNILENK